MEPAIPSPDDEQPAEGMSTGTEVRQRLLGVVVGIGLLNLAWFAVGLLDRSDGRSQTLWPSQAETWSDLWLLAVDGFQGDSLLTHTAATLARVLAAFVVALAVGGGVGVAVGSHRQLRHLLDPLISFLRLFTPIALLGMSYLLVGIDSPVVGFSAGFVATWFVADRVARLVVGDPTSERMIEELVQIARTTLLVTSLVVAFGEVIGEGVGLGSAIWFARVFGRTGMMMAVGIWSALVFAALDYGIRVLGRVLATYSLSVRHS